jgi:hypothetical protein
MADINYPTAHRFQPSAYDFGPARMVRGSGIGPLSVNEQYVELPYSHRWSQIITLRVATHAERADIEGEIERWINPANRLLIWHLARPVPRGTMRGSPTLNGAHSQGATSLVLASAGANATILRGDMLGVTTNATPYAIQLVRVVADATASGAGAVTVSIEPALRVAANTGAAIIWDKPKAMWRPVSPAFSARYVPGQADTMTLEFREVTG